MAEAISDRQIVAAVRPFVRAAGPMVDALRESDPLSLRSRPSEVVFGAEPDSGEPGKRERLLEALASMRVPGSAEWDRMDVKARTDWWINRVGRFGALLTAVPGLAGALSDRLPLQDTLGLATQGILLCAVAGEHGVVGVGDRVRLLAWVLFDRDVDPVLAEGRDAGYDHAIEDAETRRLGAELSESANRDGKVTLKAGARTVWRFGRRLFAISEELDKRPGSRIYHDAIGMLPVVGIVGDYLGERSGLKRATTKAERWISHSTT